MKQLRQLVNIHLRSGKDSDSTLVSKQKITRDSRSSVHEAFHEERSRESRLKSNLNQLLLLYLRLKSYTSPTIRGNNVTFSLSKEFEEDFSTIWEFQILNSLSGKTVVHQIVDSQKLKWIGKDLEEQYKKNTVIFEFQDGFYSLEKEKEVVYSSPTSIKKSYSLQQFKSIEERKDSLKELKSQISTILEQGKLVLQSKNVSREMKLRTREIEAMIIESSHQILGIKGKIYQIKNVLREKLEKIQESRLQGMNYAKNILKRRSELLNSTNLLGRIRVEQRHKQVELALELKQIFPLDESRNSINGLDLGDKSDEKMSSGYGLVSLLVSVLFGILNLRPRYPIILKGSRCCIIDYISLKSFPIYPLYLKGMDRHRFEYGVFLLNKNIQQILNHLGLSHRSNQTRHTIHNIGLIWKILEQGPSIPVIIEDSDAMHRSLVLLHRRAISPLKTEAWSGLQNEEEVFRID